MDRDLAFKLAAHEVITMEDLAELAVPELLEIDADLGDEKAAALIWPASLGSLKRQKRRRNKKMLPHCCGPAGVIDGRCNS